MSKYKYYGDEQERYILERRDDFIQEALPINQCYQSEADIDNRIAANDNSVWEQIHGPFPRNALSKFNFPEITPLINVVDGYQRRNRKSITAIPIENGDDATADAFTKIMQWGNERDNAYHTFSEGFRGALISGMSLFQMWQDFSSDPVSGDFKWDIKHYNSYIIDPYFRKPDLSDCKGIIVRSYLTKDEMIRLNPDKKELILGIQFDRSNDGLFQYMPENFSYNNQSRGAYDEFWYRTYRKRKVLIDVQTGLTREWSGDRDELQYLLYDFPQVTVIEEEIPTTHVAIIVQDKVIYDGPNPLNIDRYPFVPCMAYYMPQIPYFPLRVQGIVRPLRDAQYLYNIFRNTQGDLLLSQPNNGWIYKEDALVNIEDIWNPLNARGIGLKSNAQMTDIQKIPPGEIPQSMMQLAQDFSNEINRISGVNEELLGSAVDEKAGVLSMLRQGAGLTTLQMFFDNLDLSQKLIGSLEIEFIQNNFTPGKVERIIGEKAPDQFYSKAFGKYDVAIEDGVNTTTQRQMQFAQLMEMRQMFGDEIPVELVIEKSTLQGKQDLMKAIEARKQQQQEMEQEKAKAAMQVQQAQVNDLNARARANEGLGNERDSRIPENIALMLERTNQAVENRQGAFLDHVKALKEIQELDIGNLERIMNLSRALKAQEDEESARIRNEWTGQINPQL